MNTLNELKKIIYGLLPDLKEKKKVKIETIRGVEGNSIYINDIRVAGNKPWGGGKVMDSWISDDLTIKNALIGSNLPDPEISLQEVLMAIEKKGDKCITIMPAFFGAPSGTFIVLRNSDSNFAGIIGKSWNLTLPLDQQKPEVWEFLLKILK